ncbi:MAG: Hint domain-containing protein [Paracoccaceae bacterium]
MPDWIALSDRNDPQSDPAAGRLLDRGALILEVALPLAGPAVLLDYRAADGWLRALSVFHDPEMGIGILHRQGGVLVRHTLPGPLPGEVGTARIILRWDAPGRTWHLRYELPDAGQAVEARGVNPLPLPMADLLALCRGTGVTQRHPALLWFGATLGENPPERAPWIGLRTPIATPAGYRYASSLAVGEMVLTNEGLALPVQSVRHMVLPSRGFFAPVLLRAPYFAGRTDLLVSADQLVALSGPEVEYLFGEDEVLAEARHLTDGRSALYDTRRAVTSCVSLDLGAPALLQSEGCVLASTQHGKRLAQMALPRRLLRSYEAVPLLALLGRGNGSRAA